MSLPHAVFLLSPTYGGIVDALWRRGLTLYLTPCFPLSILMERGIKGGEVVKRD